MTLSTKTSLMMSAAGVSALLCCCINEDYDLSKDLDKTVCIEGDISAPIGNSETILVADLLDIDKDNTDILSVADNGDYSLILSGNRTETTFSVPSVSISRGLTEDGGLYASIGRSSLLSQIGISSESTPIPSGITLSMPLDEAATPIAIDEDVSEEVTAIRSVTGRAAGTIFFQTNIGKATVTGLSIDFPDYLNLSASPGSGNIRYSLDGQKNILTFEPLEMTGTLSTVDIEVTGIDFDKMPQGQGFLPDRHKISLSDNIVVSGAEVSILTDDLGRVFSAIPEQIQVQVGVRIGTVDISTATLKVNPKIDIEPAEISVGTYPDFITGNNTVLDLYDPQVKLSVGNGSPLTLSFNADIDSYKGSLKNTVHIGNKGASAAAEEVIINADGETGIFLSRTGDNAPDGYRNIRISDLSDIVKNLPEKISIANINAAARDEFITVQSGRDYSFHCSYEVIAPLAFGKDMRFDCSTDFTGWGEMFDDSEGDGTDYDIREADISFDFVNMLPLGISLSASAIDKNAAVIPGMEITVSGMVSAGTVTSPSRSPITLTIKASADDMRRLDGIRMGIGARGADNGCEGICLNENQGIRLENMKLRLQGTFTSSL